MANKHSSKLGIEEGATVSHYTIIEKLSNGYPDDVYLANDNNLERKALLQFLPGQYCSESEIRTAFSSQAQAFASVDHPNLVHIYEVDEHNKSPFVAMEFIGEQTLSDFVGKGELSPSHAVSIAIQISAGLKALHAAGIVYCDLRPGQIAVDDAYNTQLLLPGHLLNASVPSRQMDEKNSAEIEYFSPEQAAGEEPDYNSNIFSLGIILYEILAGKHPFRGQSKKETLNSITEAAMPPPRKEDKIPKELNLILEKALGKNRDSGYFRADYLQDDLKCVQTVISLRESEEQYRNVVERANDGICIIQDNLLKFINRRLADMVGYTVEEGINTSFADYIQRDEISKVVRKYNRQLSGLETTQRYETILVHKNGETVPVEINAGLITYEGHHASLAIVRDISERRRAERTIRESEGKFSDLFKHSNDAILIHDLEGNILDVNQKALISFGYTKPEMLALGIADLHPPSSHETSRQAFNTLKNEGDFRFEIDFKKKTGDIFTAGVSSSLIQISGKTIVQGIVRDITIRKRTERALSENRRALMTLMGNLPGMAYRCLNDRNWTMIFVSDGCKNLTGYEVSDIVDNQRVAFNELIHSDDREKVWADVQSALEQKQPFQLLYRIITRVNEEKWVWEQGSGIFSDDGDLLALEGFITDITKQKNAEEYSKKLSSIVEQSTEGIALADLDGNIQYINKAFAEMHGYSPDELLQENLSILHNADQIPEVERANREIQETGEFTGEIWHKRRDGSVFPSHMQNSLLFDDAGKQIAMIGTMRDISNRKKNEEALLLAHEQLNATLNALPDLLFEVDNQGRIYDFRAPQPELLYLPPEEFLGKTFDEVLPESVSLATTKAIHETIAKGQCSGITYSLELQGKVHWFELSAAARGDPKTSKGRLIMLVRDITDRQTAEMALRESEERYRRVFENSVLGLYRTTPNGQILMVNPALVNMLGYSSFEELADRNLEDSGYEPGYERSTFKEKIDSEGMVVGLESAWIKKDGTILHVSESARAIRDDDGRIVYFEGTVEDISERRRAEEELTKSTKVIEQERNLFVNGPVVVFKWQNRPGWPVEYVSPNVSQVLGYSVDDLISGEVAYVKIIPEEDAKRLFDEIDAFSESGVESFTHQPYRVIRKDGETIWVADYTNILRNSDGKITHYLGYVIDVTERKLAEDMLVKRTEQLNNERKALKERNITLKQILDHIESRKQDHQQQVYKEMEKALTPLLRRLREKAGPEMADEYQALEDNFNAILAKDLDEFTRRYAGLTSRESEICDFIKNGLSSKQISESLNLSILTIMKHREQIRKKLGITNKSINLATYLRSH